MNYRVDKTIFFLDNNSEVSDFVDNWTKEKPGLASGTLSTV